MDEYTLLEDAFRLTTTQKSALKKLSLLTVRDLLYHFPRSYGILTEAKYIREVSAGDSVVLKGKIEKLEKTRAFRKKIPMAKAELHDVSGKIRVVWFNQPYIANMMKDGSLVALKGKVQKDSHGLYLANPVQEHADHTSFELVSEGTRGSALQPIYVETRGITSRWFYYAIKKIFAEHVHATLKDPIHEEIRKKYHLPSLSTALVWIHDPRTMGDAEAAKKLFSFEEIFFIQLERLKARKEYQENPAFFIEMDEHGLNTFLSRLSFSLTNAQERAINQILSDFNRQIPMSRLLEGDVGSGKTVVAAATSYAVVSSRPKGQEFGNLQVAIMAPTEILATQHFESFVELFSHLPVQVGLITGSGCRKFPSKVNPASWTKISKTQLLKWTENGEIPILIGTHALIQKTVSFKHLAYVVIDEQHRFGTNQRAKLVAGQRCDTGEALVQSTKHGDSRGSSPTKHVPHLLSMTATPIPRTLALTIYGDLDLTLLDEMPPGRKPVITKIVPSGERSRAYEKVREELRRGRQVYVICPRIDEPDPEKLLALNVKSVKEEASRLRKSVFPDYTVEILHGRLKAKEKEDVMERFLRNEIHILVATSVVEVGVNVPNATTIIIEGADRFGLSQLHQLRGRVLRSTEQAYCYVFTDAKGGETLKRLKVLEQAQNGFSLAEYDLKMRGPGELSGRQQWGVSDIGMEAIKNLKMVEAARKEAQAILEKDAGLLKYPLLQKRLEQISGEIHFE